MPSTSTMHQENPLQLSNSVDLLQNRARKVADQSLQSTRRMVVMVDDSKEVGLRTLVDLDEQGDKLDMLDETHRELRDDIRQSEKALTEMEKCCGLFIVPWKRPKTTGNGDKAWKRSKDCKVVSDQPHRVTAENTFTDGFCPRILNDEGEEEMDSNLAHVHSTVGNLKNMAADIRNSALAHNSKLDQLILQADNNDQHVQAAVQRTDNLHQ